MVTAVLLAMMIAKTSAMGPPSPVPLKTAVALPINVMMLIDRSASMIAIEPESRYQSDIEFTEFDYGQEQDPQTGLIHVDGQSPGDCPSPYTFAASESGVRCLRLPPGQWYPRHYLDYLFDTYESGTDLASADADGNLPIPATTIFQRMQEAAIEFVEQPDNFRICLGIFDADADTPIVFHPCGHDRDELRTVIEDLRPAATGSLPLANVYPDVVAYFGGTVDPEMQTPVEYRCQGNAVVLFTDLVADEEAAPLGNALLAGFTTDLLDHTRLDRAGRSYGSVDADMLGQEGDFPLQSVRSFAVVPESYRHSISPAIEAGGGAVHDPSRIGRLVMDLAGRLRTHRPGDQFTTRPASDYIDNGATIVYTTTSRLATESSDLIAYLLTDSSAATRRLWSARDGIPDHDARHVFTTSESAIVPFRPSTFDGPGDPSETLINWIRGDRSLEQQMGGPYRDRTGSLGIIANGHPVSEPAIPNDPFRDPDYLAYQALMSSGGRPSMVYIAANDGMLHGFAGGPEGGQELFGYVPQLVLQRLGDIANPVLPPTLAMDGTLTVASARIGDQESGNPWRTLLVGSPGRGARGLFALDVTAPGRYREAAGALDDIVAWERGVGTATSGYADMGYHINPPAVIRTRKADDEQFWVVVAGNGIGSHHNRGVVYILDPVSGDAIQTIVLSESSGGISSVTAIDIDADQHADRLYAADLEGYLWRLDWDQQTEQFVVHRDPGGNPVAIFQATADSTVEGSLQQPQTVSTAIESGFLYGRGTSELSPHGIMLYFGTGQLLDDPDIPGSNPAQASSLQSLYGFWDAGDTVTVHRDRLAAKEIQEQTLGNRIVRTVRQLPVSANLAAQRGWVIDLPASQERVIEKPALVHGRVQFTTLAGSRSGVDPCTDAPARYFIEVDAETGRATPQPLLDLNNDGQVDDADLTAGGEAPAGFDLDDNHSDPISLRLDDGSGPTLSRSTLGPDGEVDHVVTPILTVRRAWRQMAR